MDQFECTVCGYVYNPQKGVPEQQVAPGTGFEELTDGWRCPICNSGKEHFTPAAPRN